MHLILKYLLIALIEWNSDKKHMAVAIPVQNLQRSHDFIQTQASQLSALTFLASTTIQCQTSTGISFQLTNANEIRDAFPDSPVPKYSTTSHVGNCFHDTWSMHDRNCSGWPPTWSEVTIMWPICTALSYGPKDSHWEICLCRLYYRTAQKATKMYHKHVMHELNGPDGKLLQYRQSLSLRIIFTLFNFNVVWKFTPLF